jgi:hypothetical protein
MGTGGRLLRAGLNDLFSGFAGVGGMRGEGELLLELLKLIPKLKSGLLINGE